MIPESIPNWIGGSEVLAASGALFDKLDPSTGRLLWRGAASQAADVEVAVSAAMAARAAWAATPGVQRGQILRRFADLVMENRDELSGIVARETGKSPKDALGEVGGAAQLGWFYASEGQRLFGRTTTSGQDHRIAMTVRRPRGIAALVIAANTPAANVAWKVFPALVCGNPAILKASEDAPATAWFFGKLAVASGIPAGVFSVLQGLGPEVGEPLVSHPEVRVISFTGSTAVGQQILAHSTGRLARVSLELGGKNALVVCDDANLDTALRWTMLSAFSNAGQRCAAASRIVIFDRVYEEFRDRLVAGARALRVGPSDADDLGPVINERQLRRMVDGVASAVSRGAVLLTGGDRLVGPAHAGGFYMAPTLLEGVDNRDSFCRQEWFGPLASLHRVGSFDEALDLVNDSPYGLTAAIHTRDLDRALRFAERADVGVVTVNGGTYGSEPHMPFGGTKLSGNGTREPGTEALDVYSELQNLYINLRPSVA